MSNAATVLLSLVTIKQKGHGFEVTHNVTREGEIPTAVTIPSPYDTDFELPEPDSNLMAALRPFLECAVTWRHLESKFWLEESYVKAILFKIDKEGNDLVNIKIEAVKPAYNKKMPESTGFELYNNLGLDDKKINDLKSCIARYLEHE